MATKSFTSEFKFNQRSGVKLANAIEKSRRVEEDMRKTVTDVTQPETIKNIMDNFLGRE